jgi:putative ABC transport system substrate-binding protein
MSRPQSHVVMLSSSADPVRQGLVASLAHPGGNVTGFTDFATDLASKRMDLLMETLPGTTVAFLWHTRSPVGAAQFKAIEAAARRLGE